MYVANELFAANNFAELLSQCLRNASRATEIDSRYSQRADLHVTVRTSSPSWTPKVLVVDLILGYVTYRMSSIPAWDEDEATAGNEDIRGPGRQGR